MVLSAHTVAFEPEVNPLSLTMRWWMQVASMENSRLCDSLHWVERHQDLPTEPDIDPSRAGGRGRFSQAAGRPALPFVRRAQGCPEPTARSSGAAPHDRTCAPGSTAVRSPHSIRRTRDAADPEHRFWRYPASISFPYQRPSIDTRSAAGRQSSLGSIALRRYPKKTQPICSAGCQTSGEEKRWSPGSLSTAITNERSGRTVGRVEFRLSSYRRLTSRVFEDHGECWTGHGEWPS
jgi:hypothetical protein